MLDQKDTLSWGYEEDVQSQTIQCNVNSVVFFQYIFNFDPAESFSFALLAIGILVQLRTVHCEGETNS